MEGPKMVASAGRKRSYKEMRSEPPWTRPMLSDVTPHKTQDFTLNEPPLSQRRDCFAPRTSFFLVGLRGTGKSSLAVLAANAYSYRVVELQRAFLDRTGQTPSAHRREDKSNSGRRLRQEISQNIIETYRTDTVIVVEFSDLEYAAPALLACHATHPVIFIDRDTQGMQRHLQLVDAEALSQSSSSVLRKYSNHEYFNLTDNNPEEINMMSVSSHLNDFTIHGREAADFRFLTLKRAERDFLKFLGNIVGDDRRGPSHQTASPLSELRFWHRTRAYAAVINVSQVLDGTIDLLKYQFGADALILRVIEQVQDDSRCARDAAMAFAVLRRSTILPIIVDVVISPADTSDTYSRRWSSCYRFAPDAMTIDVSKSNTTALTRDSLSTRVRLIAVDKTSNGFENAQKACQRAISLGCVLLLLEGLPTEKDELISLQAEWTSNHRSTLSVSAFNSTPSGRFSQIMNPGLLPVRGYHNMSDSSALTSSDAPQLTAKDVTTALFACYFFTPLKFHILGSNVDFSLSPAMHNAAYAVLGQPHSFATYSTPSLDVLDTLRKADDFGGAAVTAPFKVPAVQRMDVLSDHATIIRAINTILPLRADITTDKVTSLQLAASRNRSGPVLRLYGDNTDWIGIRSCICRGLSPANAIRSTSSGLVIGAGGMARAAVYAMIHLGVQHIFVHSQTEDKANALAAHFNSWMKDTRNQHDVVRVLSSIALQWPDNFRLPTMIVSSVPAIKIDGVMQGTFTLPQQWLESPSGGVVVELTYNPLITALVHQVRELADRGWIIMTGLDMLPEQAFAQFELFTARPAPRQIMREEVLKAFEKGYSQAG